MADSIDNIHSSPKVCARNVRYLLDAGSEVIKVILTQLNLVAPCVYVCVGVVCSVDIEITESSVLHVNSPSRVGAIYTKRVRREGRICVG